MLTDPAAIVEAARARYMLNAEFHAKVIRARMVLDVAMPGLPRDVVTSAATVALFLDEQDREHAERRTP